MQAAVTTDSVASGSRATLIDSFGRRHNNLRISVTDRCNLRCTYCMPEEVTFQPRASLLTFEEITRFARVAASLGINKLRLTGGEPLVRAELATLVRMLAAIPGIEDVGLTTNGILLARCARELYDAGLRRINISLDSLDREQFRAITRRDALEPVLEGIEAARAAGFQPIKINAVAIKGETDSQVVPLAQFCRDRNLEMRFIEFMPLEADNIWQRQKVLTAAEILAKLAAAGIPAVPIDSADPSAPASEFVYADGKGRLGIVASVTRPFCGTCNRIRITADGKLRNCLFALDELDVRAALRGNTADGELAQMIRQSVAGKWEGHQINSVHFIRPGRTMHTIGG